MQETKLAQEIQGRIPIRSLITIDPISTIDCTPAVFINSIAASAPAKGCTESPKDFHDEDIRQIGRHVDGWVNFFQTRTAFLHSSPIRRTPRIINV